MYLGKIPGNFSCHFMGSGWLAKEHLFNNELVQVLFLGITVPFLTHQWEDTHISENLAWVLQAVDGLDKED